MRFHALPKLGTRVRLIWGDEAFTEMNFTPIFIFIMHDVYVATVSSLNVFVFWKILHFPKLNSSLKQLPILGDFPL